jgi:predicted Zn-dependent protease
VVVFHQALRSVSVDRGAWERQARELSKRFASHPEILESHVSLRLSETLRHIVNSEGSELQTTHAQLSLAFAATAVADDGMRISVTDSIDASDQERLPASDTIALRIESLIDMVRALRDAPPAEPYVGPAILDGRAAAVFFHEVFGHRVEGHRQKHEAEGQTFAQKIGDRVMPSFVQVFDDPTIVRINGIDLNGRYRYDDEAVAAERVTLIEDGRMAGFLMSRSPVRGFSHSNGHGRRQPGYAVVARQGNLMVAPTQSVSRDVLKDMLLAEIVRQGKPYGLRFTDIRGGYTMTRRGEPQAFKVTPVVVYRVWNDGREQLIRGVDLEGTPLTVLSQIIAAADAVEVFNGFCGAESGSVPVSATSPALLVAQVEVARKPKSQDRPPLLPPPSIKVQP